MRKAGLISSAEMAVSVFPVSPQATTKDMRQAHANDERESVTLDEEAPAPITGPIGGKEEEEEQEEEEGGDGDPGPPFTQLERVTWVRNN